MRIPLVLLHDRAAPPAEAQRWPLGPVIPCATTPAAVLSALVEQLAQQHRQPDAWLLWDARLALPEPEAVGALLDLPAEVVHAGLSLGSGGLPRMLDFVAPAWMLHRDPDPGRPATSWRVSLRACLVRHSVWGAWGLVSPAYATLEAAGLELGLRWIRQGARCRHVPSLLPATARAAEVPQPVVPLTDELRIIRQHWGMRWVRWAAWRAGRNGYASRRALRGALRAVRDHETTVHGTVEAPPVVHAENQLAPSEVEAAAPSAATRQASAQTAQGARSELSAKQVATATDARVTVLIPTIERYAYLRVVLEQLREQTVPPSEIIIVDQTPAEVRERERPELVAAFTDLPVTWLTLDEAGQCISRNAGLSVATGTHILFLDDDDEIPPTLIAQHLAHLAATGADASCGVADELGAGELPAEFRIPRVSDVFPTNNAMLKREALRESGLFDLAYNRGARADGDLGMRLYLAGRSLQLAPHIRVLHHHAPRGGLRTHNARRITYASSRMRLWHRHLPSVTQLYFHLRYFTPRQVYEAQVIGALGTLVGRGPRWRRAAKALVGAVLLPHTWWVIGRRMREAKKLFVAYPQIPSLPEEPPRGAATETQHAVTSSVE